MPRRCATKVCQLVSYADRPGAVEHVLALLAHSDDLAVPGRRPSVVTIHEALGGGNHRSSVAYSRSGSTTLATVPAD